VSEEHKVSIEKLIKELILALGENPERPGLLKTPERVAKTYEKMLEGYSRSLEKEITTFDNSYKYDDLIYSGKIDYFSMCEHHMLPFYGMAHIAYVPSDKIIGLSKLARAVDIFSRRLQEQERLTVQVATELDRLLRPKGIIVLLEGRHFCNTARGVEKASSNMKTIISRGCFKDDEKLYNRFFQIIADPSDYIAKEVPKSKI
jgi:GTP cyclohydrolase I